MSSAADELWQLQQVDSRVRALERELADLDTGNRAQKIRDLAQTKLDEAASRLRAIEAELNDIELSVKSTETKARDMEQRMYSGKVGSPKELEAMGQDVDMLKRNKDRLETRELELMDEQTEAMSNLERSRKVLAAKQGELDQILSTSASEKERLQADLVQAAAERKAQAEVVQASAPALYKKYENLRAKLANVAMAGVEANRCAMCKVQLSSGLMDELRTGESIPTCESCGRMLHHAG